MAKNILIIISQIGLGNGGAEKTSVELENHLFTNGYNTHFLTFYNFKNRHKINGNYKCLNEKQSNIFIVKFYKLFKRTYEIYNYCTINNIDCTISFMEESNFPNILSKLLLKNKSKIIISSRNNSLKKPKINKKLIKILYNYSDKIVSLSKEEKNNLIIYFKIQKNKIKVIYNGILLKNNHKEQKIDKEDNCIFNNGKFSFINIGRLSKAKNHKLLLETFETFNEKYINSQLIILGDGELKEKLLNQKEELLSKNNIYFLGKKYNIYPYLIESDCFVFSSSWEGFGHVLIEAMSCGIPIISTDCTAGPKEILKEKLIDFKGVIKSTNSDYGILSPINNQNELFKSMETMYLNEIIRKQYSKKSLKRVTFFEKNKVFKQWIEII